MRVAGTLALWAARVRAHQGKVGTCKDPDAEEKAKRTQAWLEGWKEGLLPGRKPENRRVGARSPEAGGGQLLPNTLWAAQAAVEGYLWIDVGEEDDGSCRSSGAITVERGRVGTWDGWGKPAAL